MPSGLTLSSVLRLTGATSDDEVEANTWFVCQAGICCLDSPASEHGTMRSRAKTTEPAGRKRKGRKMSSPENTNTLRRKRIGGVLVFGRPRTTRSYFLLLSKDRLMEVAVDDRHPVNEESIRLD